MAGPCQVQQVCHGFEWIIDLMGNRCGKSSHCREPSFYSSAAFGQLALGDVDIHSKNTGGLTAPIRQVTPSLAVEPMVRTVEPEDAKLTVVGAHSLEGRRKGIADECIS